MQTSPSLKEKNAIITSVSLTNGDYDLLTAYLQLDFGGMGQGFGGYCLYTPKKLSEQKNYAGHFINRCLEIAGVDAWSKLVGKTVRARSEWTRVHAIGHIVKDDWFNPSEDFKALDKA